LSITRLNHLLRISSIMQLAKRLGAEIFGTFWLVLGGCGSAVLAAASPHVGIGLAGVSLAFGLTVLTMAYAIGHISGCHLNPAVSVGLTVAGRFPARDLAPYIVAQVIGAVLGAYVSRLSRTARPASIWSRAASRRTASASTRRATTRCSPRSCAKS
jgi:aquaporin Z